MTNKTEETKQDSEFAVEIPTQNPQSSESPQITEIDANSATELTATSATSDSELAPRTSDSAGDSRGAYRQFILLPAIFITVALLGGLRIGADGGDFIFVVPALVCLIFALVALALFFRSGLLRFEKWFSAENGGLARLSRLAVIAALFGATTQVFNSTIPEQGLPFWVIAFCYLWILWSQFFTAPSAKMMLRSLGAMLGFAFIAKYILLASLVSGSTGNWFERLWQSPTQEAFTYLLDIPRFAAATGYIQFFAIILYLFGLYLLESNGDRSRR